MGLSRNNDQHQHNMNINQAIERSRSHNEIVRVPVESIQDAISMAADAIDVAKAAGLDYDTNDTNLGMEVWAGPAGSDQMTWRIELVVEGG